MPRFTFPMAICFSKNREIFTDEVLFFTFFYLYLQREPTECHKLNSFINKNDLPIDLNITLLTNNNCNEYI